MANNLITKKCKPCEGGTPPLSREQVQELLQQIPDWKVDDENTTIMRSWEFKRFKESIVFVNMVAKLVEEERHHPNIHMHNYNYVSITLSTLAIDGLSENDFIVAAKIDQLFEAE